MYGLVMLREYLDEILSSKKTYDARAYDTNIRGLIALVDTRKSQIIGTVELIGTHLISSEEYLNWHKTKKWKNVDFEADPNRLYYAYDFKDPIMLDTPIRIKKTGRTWCTFEADVLEKKSEQISLF